MFQISFDTRERIDVAFAHERERFSFFTGATRTSDAVNVIFRIIRQLEVHDHVDTFDVEAASRDVGRDQDVVIALASELLHHARALRLSHQRRNADRGVTVVVQELRDSRNVHLEVREHDRLARLVEIQEREKMRTFFFAADVEDLVFDVLRFRLIARHVHFHRVRSELISGVHDVEIQRRAEHEELTLLRNTLEDELHVVFEAHVEHAIGFVEDDRANLFQVDEMFFEEIDQPTRSRDDELDAVTKTFFLFLVGNAAVDRNRTKIAVSAKLQRALVNLFAKFPSRNENQDELVRTPIRKRTLFAFRFVFFGELIGIFASANDALHDRKQKRSSLAGARLRKASDVASFEDVRHRSFLDRGGFCESLFLNSGEQ